MSSSAEAFSSPASAAPIRRRLPATLWIGLAIILLCEVLLYVNVQATGRGAIHSDDELRLIPRAVTRLQSVAEFVAVNMTALAWLGYLVFMEGVLTAQRGRSPVRLRPHHFATLWLASVFIWCVFDTINFYSIKAWVYVGMPPLLRDKIVGYLLAFGAVVPGMLMSGQAYLNAGLVNWARGPKWKLPRAAIWLTFLGGAAMLAWPLIDHSPRTNLTLWCSLVFLVDPINDALGRPSMLRDWQNGWYGRTLACFAGGLTCGLLWEFWNYWAITKWTYHLPFLGAAEHYRYFEMPLVGLIGFLPFGVECWIMWQFIRIPLDGLAEPLPDAMSLL